MGILGRNVFREIVSSAVLGSLLFTFVLFLQRLGKLFEMLVRSSAPPQTVGYLFLLILPPVLTLTIPIGVLVGVLIALSRMSSDGEVVAMRAAGVPSRRLAVPVLLFATAGMSVAGACSLWLTPWATRETFRVLNQLISAQLTAEILPRVFSEQFPNTILYVGDVIPSDPVRWRKVFIADFTEKKKGPQESGEGPRITVASETVAVADIARNALQLSMTDASSHEAGLDVAEYYSSQSRHMDQVLAARERDELRPKEAMAIDTIPLLRAPRDSVEERIELHTRFARPAACFLFALIAIPLGIGTRKAGKSLAFVLTVVLGFGYYMGFVSLVGLAQKGTLPAWLAVWLPNLVYLAAAAALFARLDSAREPRLLPAMQAAAEALAARLRSVLPTEPASAPRLAPGSRWFLLPQVVDAYVLRLFCFYFGVLLASFVLMTLVYNFFELLGDIVKNQIPMAKVARYFFFLTPKLLYDSTPMSVLVAVLVTFGILAKNNEVTAFKACGVSLHRLALPVFVMTALLSGGLFAFDHYIVPEANRIQDALRAEIKGRAVQTYLNPARRFILNDKEARIYYYKYLDASEQIMGGVQVFELVPQTYRLRRHISAERARWEPSMNAWIFQNGWSREFQGLRDTFHDFRLGTATFRELSEPPSYFLRELKQDKQMNFQELAGYIRDLQQSGFDTISLQVQYHKKFAVPLFALIMAMISVPFAFLAGNRGAMAGVGISFGIAIAYWTVSILFEQIGKVNQLPAVLAAWSPDALFSLSGLYLLSRLRT
ncbi:MAG TPA: LPS export ABC transporter permease LptF [Solibacterales bacterium]|nr:LPS export ABC transporter permease LptF [Bryobacterales bacterium]